jgi:hypothetical protein
MSMNIKLSQNEHGTTNASSGLKRLSTTIALGVLLLVQFNTEAQATPPGASGLVDPIVGTWNVVADIYDCNTGNPIFTGSQSLGLFNADGTRHETNATSPALRTPAYGNWHRVNKNEYEFAFKYYRFDAAGANIGSTSVRHELFLAADKSSYFSEGIAEFFNPAGNLLFVACSSATATRYE